jgi:DNA-binding NarL/FixJ family response regulator
VVRPRVAVADDAPLLRDGLRSILTEDGMEVVAVCADVQELMAAVEDTSPDVAVVDLRMPPTFGMEGLVACQVLRRIQPDLGLVLLSSFLEVEVAAQLLGLGDKVGYLLKERVAGAGAFTDAVRSVAEGGVVLDPQISVGLLEREEREGGLSDLTEREIEVLQLLAEGCSNQAVGDRLFLAPKTVEGHIRSLFAKLGLEDQPGTHRRVLAVLAYLRRTSRVSPREPPH